MCTSCFASSSYINPDLLQDKKIQRDLMSTWPLAARPLESRWFGVEELPEAHLSFDVCFFPGEHEIQ